MSLAFYPAGSRIMRSSRYRSGRAGSGLKSDKDDSIPLDINQDPNDILKEILRNICGQHNVSTSRKLGHLNNFVKLLCHLSDSSLITVPMEVIMTSLKGALVSDVKEVRAASVRVLRYLINDDRTKRLFVNLHLDYLVTRCLDISHFNEVERIEAVRLIRKIAHIKRKRTDDDVEPIVPLSLMACVVSISLDGAAERDRVYRTCLAVLCELALLQPWLVVKCNGVLALVNAILECHMYQRINESLCLSFMHIVNHPGLRKWHLPVLDVSPTFAPYTELNYRLHPDDDESMINKELEKRFMASRMAIVSLLRTWTGLLHICHSKNMIPSFIDALAMPNQDIRRGILSVLSELFYFNELLWTDDFHLALKAAAPGHFRDSWRISDGFVVAEGKSLLPVRHVSRPDLVDCHLAILLSCFIQAGLLKALTDVATSTDSHSSVSAIIVLGSVLHLASRLLPLEYDMSSWQSHLPHLLKSDSSRASVEDTLRLNVTVKRLQEVYAMRHSPPKPYSVYLSQLLSKKSTHSSTRTLSFSSPSRGRSITFNEADSSSGTFSVLKRNRSLNLIRDFTDDHSLTALKNTKVLASKEHKEWDWEALQCLFLAPQSATFLKLVAVDEMVRRFYRRLIYFYQPSSRLFSSLDLSKDENTDKNRIYVETAILMMKHLAYADEEGQRLLKNLIANILDALPKVNGEATSYSKATGSLAVTCSREYFLILAALSSHDKGDKLLNQSKAYHYFIGLASKDTHETHIRLLVSSLHYSEVGAARTVLNKVLTTCSESARLYATGFLRVLLRANYPGFQRWGTEMLTTQLFDSSNEVALEALDILHEACDDTDYLRAVVSLRPTLLHLGERGAILVCRFMSVPQGFAYLSRNNYLNRELHRWMIEYNERYVTHVEELLKLSLTSYERANKEGFARRTGNKKSRQSVFLPAHLYGELCRHKEGAALIEREKIASRIGQSLQELLDENERRKKTKKSLKKELPQKEDDVDVQLLKMKSYLWALAHIGSTIYGLPLLERCGGLPIITSLATTSPVSSIRGTCIYCLSTIAQTIPGVTALQKFGYQSVMRTISTCDSRDENGQITPPPSIVTSRPLRSDGKSSSVSSQLSSPSTSYKSHFKKSSVGSLSSTSSDVAVSTSIGTLKSIRSSKKSSFKRKTRHNRSASEVKASCNDSSSVFSEDPVDDEEARVPSPIRSYTASTMMRKRSLPTSSIMQRRTRTIGSLRQVNVQSSKFNRFLDYLLRRNRKKSMVGSNQNGSSSQSSDDFFSSLHPDDMSDQSFPLEAIIEHQKKPDDSDFAPIHLPTQMHVIQKSHILSAPPLSCSSTSAETVKTGEEDSKSSRDPRLPDGREGKDVAQWNTNNSGQFDANEAGDFQPFSPLHPSTNNTFPPHPDASPASSNKLRMRTSTSLPNIAIGADVGALSSARGRFRSYHDIGARCRADTESSAKTQADDPSPRPKDCDVEIAPSGADNSSQSMKSSFGFDDSSEIRARGNTQTSYDSGVILDVNQTASRDNSPRTRMNDVISGELPPAYARERSLDEEYDQWRYVLPKGLAGLCLVRGDEHRAIDSRHAATLDWSMPRSDVLTSDERDYVIRSTHYVGIVVPKDLSLLFMPSIGQIPRTELITPSLLMEETQNKDKQLEEAELLRERKVSVVRQAPKLRGLDESTFGPAVLAGLDSHHGVRMHTTVMTPCGRTPDSILSETIDFCYIDGQLVEPGSEEHIAFLHRDIVQLVTNLASSVGVKAHETSLLMMKEKKPGVFDSTMLFNNIIHIMSEHSFRLTARRFVQELFQDVKFTEIQQEAANAIPTD